MENTYLKLFLAKPSEYRQWMSEVQIFDGYLYATDAFRICRTKGELPDPINPYKSISSLPELFVQGEKLGEIKASEVNVFLQQHKTQPVFKESAKDCRECNGEGYVECEYGHEHECPECDGDGSETKVDKTEIVGYSFGNLAVSVFGKTLNPRYLQDVFSDGQDFDVYENKKLSLLFKNNQFEVVVMQNTNNENTVYFNPAVLS